MSRTRLSHGTTAQLFVVLLASAARVSHAADSPSDGLAIEARIRDQVRSKEKRDDQALAFNQILQRLREHFEQVAGETRLRYPKWTSIAECLAFHIDTDVDASAKPIADRLGMLVADFRQFLAHEKPSIPETEAIGVALVELVAVLSDVAVAHDKASKEYDDVHRDLRGYGIGDGLRNVLVLVGPEATVSARIESVERQCLEGKPIEKIGLDLGLMNVTRQEGTTPAVVDNTVRPDDEAGQAIELRLRRTDAILVMVVDYEGQWKDSHLVRACQRPILLKQAGLTSVEAGSWGYVQSGGNRIDLLPRDLRDDVQSRIETQRYVVLPIRRLIHYKASRAADDILQAGQEIELVVTRATSGPERDRIGARAAESMRLRWSFRLAGPSSRWCPNWLIRVPILVGLLPGRVSGGHVWTVGSAISLTARWGGETYFGLDLMPLYVGKTVTFSGSGADDAKKATSSVVFGHALQVDLSGYLAFGAGFANDFDLHRYSLLFTLSLPPSVLQRLGLDWFPSADGSSSTAEASKSK